MTQRNIRRVRKLTNNPAKFDRCVKEVQEKGGAANAYAVCTAAGTRANASYRVKFSNGLWRVYDRHELLYNAETEQEARTWLRNYKLRVKQNPITLPELRGETAGPSEFAAAAEASEEFHGTDAHQLLEVETEVFDHDNLGDLGELISMDIASIDGGIVHLKNFEGARLAQSPKGYPFQLFIVGGDQSVDLEEFGIDEPHELEVLGKLKRITYYTIKKHLGRDGGEANFKHKLGEVSGKLPHVIYDVMNETLSIAGGGYTILPEGIDD